MVRATNLLKILPHLMATITSSGSSAVSPFASNRGRTWSAVMPEGPGSLPSQPRCKMVRDCSRIGTTCITYRPERVGAVHERARLVVLVAEVGGRWSKETVDFLSSLAWAKVRDLPVERALCCAAAKAFAM